MRILFIDQYRNLGGGQVVLKSMMAIAKRFEHSLILLAPKGGDFEQSVQGIDLDFYSLPELSLNSGKKNLFDLLKIALSPLFFLSKFSLFLKADLIYNNGARWFFASLVLSPLLKNKKIIYHVHLDHSLMEKKLLQYIIKSPRTEKVIVCSEFLRDKLIAYNPIFQSPKLEVIANSISSSIDFTTFKNRFLSDSKINIAIVGRISYEKGQDRVINIASSFPELKFYIIGDSDFQKKDFMEQLKLDAPENVHFVGKINNISDFFNSTPIHISIVPSRVNESFGLVAVESMALSAITLLTPNGGLAEIGQKTGAIIFHNESELQSLLAKLLSQTHLTELARRQYEKTLEHYGPQYFDERWSTSMGL